ncbi:DUF397 domain-containing protein [Kineosporia sp. NBRC 101731]|uniref:DUF397 domain-containing protein n=1 Tax=Kineosporia sp. NBRC 101731 TaxID=3032199 RepID=UPI0024A58A7C|nr:DUF397 domain-containing protein [Kineosporia sp. NBRC 101731]GLY29087.1 hypothetical protein Kisp02_24520 [Kineosporia sp. NBRC 101731]
MTAETPDPSLWIKSGRSAQNNNCVEMRRASNVEVRDTKQRGHGPTLQLDRGAFAAWVAGAKSGELDHLLSE